MGVSSRYGRRGISVGSWQAWRRGGIVRSGDFDAKIVACPVVMGRAGMCEERDGGPQGEPVSGVWAARGLAALTPGGCDGVLAGVIVGSPRVRPASGGHTPSYTHCAASRAITDSRNCEICSSHAGGRVQGGRAHRRTLQSIIATCKTDQRVTPRATMVYFLWASFSTQARSYKQSTARNTRRDVRMNLTSLNSLGRVPKLLVSTCFRRTVRTTGALVLRRPIHRDAPDATGSRTVVSGSGRRGLETPRKERPQFRLTPTTRPVLGTGYFPTTLRRSDNRTETYKDRRAPAFAGKAPRAAGATLGSYGGLAAFGARRRQLMARAPG